MQEGKEKGEEKPVSAEQVLTALADRWRGAATLEYRSQLILTHQGEPGLRGTLRVQLRRPRLARVEVAVDNPEFCCLRVSDGRVCWHRGKGTPLRPATTQPQSLVGGIMGGILHPLDEASYSVDQFLARWPFLLPGAEVVRTALRHKERGREVFTITQTQGTSRDTLTVEAKTYTPLRLVRVGDHGGTVQELLREEFQEVVMGGALAPRLFRWNPEDEARP